MSQSPPPSHNQEEGKGLKAKLPLNSMKIELYAKDGEFHAKYEWGEEKGVPLNARMGLGPPGGYTSKDLRNFLNTVTEHIMGIENIEPIYGDGISEDLKAATSVLFNVLGKNNRYKSQM